MCDQNSLFFTVSIPKNNGFVTTEHVAKFGDDRPRDLIGSIMWMAIEWPASNNYGAVCAWIIKLGYTIQPWTTCDIISFLSLYNVYTKTKNTVYSEVWTIIGKWHVLDSISARFKSVLQPVC